MRRSILCIRPRLNSKAGTILTVTSDEWVESLKLQARVEEVESDFDLQHVVESTHPDLIILDAVNWTRPWPLTIRNARSYPEIPRILYLNSDPHDPMRALTVRMMEDLGIDTVFATAEAYYQHMPDLKNKTCFLIPQFIDGDLFRDFGEQKSIPVSVFGAHFMPKFYAWRAGMLAEIEGRLPLLAYPHPGYLKGANNPFAIQGEAYARVVNRCFFSLSDTTQCDYLVRKHLEIPACGTVLVAPASQALDHYGFVDGENCLLGEGPELVRKMAELAADPDRYNRVRAAGHALVHGRYTQKSWTFFLDWLACRDGLQPGQIIRQTAVYGPFQASAPPPRAEPKPVERNQMTLALRDARTAILSGQGLGPAERRLLEVAEWLPHVAEPYFLCGVMALLRNDPETAALAIGRRAESQGNIDPSLRLLDPVEIAWLTLITHLTGNAALGRAIRAQAAGLDHLSMRRMFWFVDGAKNDPTLRQTLLVRQPTDMPSVHWLGEESWPDWCQLISRVLFATTARMIAPRDLERVLPQAA